MTTTYYKITNKEENHNGYQYKDGLNILEEPFNEDIKNECGKDGFYFTTKEHIKNYLHLGVHIRVVELPIENPDFKMMNGQYLGRRGVDMFKFWNGLNIRGINLNIVKRRLLKQKILLF